MKNLLFAMLIALSVVGCKNDKKDTVKADDSKVTTTNEVKGDVVSVDESESTLWYKGTKVGGAHEGNVSFKDGEFKVENGNLVGGEFIVDMKSITNTDLPEDKKGDLVGHLSSPDFFDVETYPTAKFEILSVKDAAEGSDYNKDVEGNLTIKNTTKTITIPANVTVNGDDVSLESSFKIDRTDFDVMYGSGKLADVVKDKAISDIIEMKVNAES